MKSASNETIQAMQNDVMRDYDDGMDEIAIRNLVRDVASQYGFEPVQWCEDAGWFFRNDKQEFLFGWTETKPNIGFEKPY